MTLRHRTSPRAAHFISIPEPKGTPQRMECRTCKAQPGALCISSSGGMRIGFHLSRWRDFNALRGIELRLELMR